MRGRDEVYDGLPRAVAGEDEGLNPAEGRLDADTLQNR